VEKRQRAVTLQTEKKGQKRTTQTTGVAKIGKDDKGGKTKGQGRSEEAQNERTKKRNTEL